MRLGYRGVAYTDTGLLTSERLGGVALVMVASRDHPLAAFKGTIPKTELGKYIQFVPTDRSDLSAGRELGVSREARLPSQRSGLGRHAVPHGQTRHCSTQAGHSLDRGRAAGRIDLAESAVYPTAAPPGPAL
jgi:hypothetical protein